MDERQAFITKESDAPISSASRSWFSWLTVGVAAAVIFGLVWNHFPAQAQPANRIHLVLAVSTDAKAREAFRQTINEFTASHPEISVQVLELAGDYYQKLLVMIAGGNAPDLMWMGEPFSEFAERGVFLDVTENFNREIDASSFPHEACDWYRVGDRQYGAAYGFDLRFIVYNKQLFKDAGVAYPKAGWTYDDFLDAAKRLTRTDSSGQVAQYGFRGSLDVSEFGAKVLEPNNRRAACNTPQMLDFLKTNLALAEEYHVAPHGKETPNEAFEDPVSVFRQGRAAMVVMATWNLPFLQQQCADMDWDVTMNPKVRQLGHWASSEAILISKSTQHPREAWMLNKVFLAPKFQQQMAGIIVPSNREAAREWISTNESKPARLDQLVEATKFMQRSPRTHGLLQVMRVFYDCCDSVWSCRATPESAMARAQSQIDRILTDLANEDR